MVVLVFCKNKDHPIKNEGTRVFTTLYITFFRRSKADNSRVCGDIRPKFKLLQAFMHVLVTCKKEDDSVKNEGARVVTTFLQL